MFPTPKPPDADIPQQSNTSRRRAEPAKPSRKRSAASDDFGDDEIDDDALVKASFGDLEFEHIENFANPTDSITRKNTAKNKSAKLNNQPMTTQSESNDADDEPVQLANGKWACNHPCKDKHSCKHMCCKEGMDKPPKKTAKTKRRSSGDYDTHTAASISTQKPKHSQSKLRLKASKRKISSAIEELDLTQQEKKKKADYANKGPWDYRGLHQLHKAVQKTDPPANLLSVMHKKPAYCYSQGGAHNLSFMPQSSEECPETSSDYGDIPLEEPTPQFDSSATHEDMVRKSNGPSFNDFMYHPTTAPVTSRGSDTFGDDDSLLGDAMVGLADSQNLRDMNTTNTDHVDPLDEGFDMDYETAFGDEDLGLEVDMDLAGTAEEEVEHEDSPVPSPPPPPKCTEAQLNSYVANKDASRTSQPQSQPRCITTNFNPAQSTLQPVNPNKVARHSTTSGPNPPKEDKSLDIDVLDLIDAFDDEPSPAPEQEEKDEQVPDAYKDLEPWLFREFGDIVELVE
jgi:ATP-dependent DNA helicase HFM1/MER3